MGILMNPVLMQSLGIIIFLRFIFSVVFLKYPFNLKKWENVLSIVPQFPAIEISVGILLNPVFGHF